MQRYRYVGPAEVRAALAGAPPGSVIGSQADLGRVLLQLGADRGDPCTYVVDADGQLRLHDRRSEHVACAGGGEVLAAGEIAFERDARGWRVTEASNQSTGYCPQPSSFVALAAVLDSLDIAHPPSFTHAFDFRCCTSCGERNLVKEADFVCTVCGGELPSEWNLDGDDRSPG